VFMRQFVLICCFCLGISSYAISLNELLNREERPDVFETLQLPESELAGLIVGNERFMPVTELYESILKRILPMLEKDTVFFLARDMDSVRDSVRIVLHQAGLLSQYDRRARRLLLSRKISQNERSAPVRIWLNHQGLDFNEILSGRLTVTLFDNGYRSNAFSRIFHEMCRHVYESRGKYRLEQITQGVHPWLIDAYGEKTYGELTAEYGTRDIAEICEEYRYYRPGEGYAIQFPALFTTNDERAEAGMDLRNPTEWLMNNWDRRNRHWNSRPLSLDASGKKATHFEAHNERDARVDRRVVLATQYFLHKHLTQPEVMAALQPALSRLKTKAVPTLARPPGLTPSVPAMEPPILDIWRSPQGTVLGLVKKISVRDNVIIWKAQVIASKRWVALKIGRLTDEGLGTVQADLRHQRRLRDVLSGQGIRDLTTPVIEHGPNYVIKEWSDQNAADWLDEWHRRGEPANEPMLLDLADNVKRLSAAGIYVRNLEPHHVGMANGRFVMLNNGGINDGGDFAAISPEEAKKRYQRNFEKRWGVNGSQSCPAQILQAVGG